MVEFVSTELKGAGAKEAFGTPAGALQHEPPWPFTRTITLALCALAVAALAYACLVSMDIVVTAQGRVIPPGRSRVVQPPEAGVVKSIAVRDGQSVSTGDLLVELDSTQELRSPIDGVVQQLAVSTVGSVVTQAQALMTVVPADAALEVETQVLDRDVGQVKVGQRVINKVETFDFMRYGSIEGTVLWVGTDAVNDQKLGPVYPVRIRLASAHTPGPVPGRVGAVSEGLNVTVDIRTGERRLIQYLLSPLADM